MNSTLQPLPLVSVIIPTYNRAGVVRRAVQSVLNQDYRHFEVLVVDDGSTDETGLFFRKINNDRLQFIRLEKNVGGAQARNIGLNRARGEFVAFLDSDDEWLPSKLTKQVQKFRDLPEEYGLVYCGLLFVHHNGKPGKEYLMNASGSFLDDLLVQNLIGSMSSVMVKKRFLQPLGGFDPLMKSCQDWELYIRLMKMCRFHAVNEALVRYHIDKDDRSRISNRIDSVLQGHVRLMEKFKDDYDCLPREKKIRHAKRMTNLFLEVGDWGRASYFLKQSSAGESPLPFFAKQTWCFLKCIRNKIRKKTRF
ncbi:MAG: putative teichuronic acid biosynthesis glycosyltransferase TuaG [Syntrophorhabdaceae bacterium PtaU1.Bin034]|nr:MAG: putative teichuronic acid biosynthesis glycosyltransferase TuaG [Syntrophorhabdaceae bacterium PtaU1.Bin034]